MEKKQLEFVHVELKRDTWMTPEIDVKHPEDAVEAVGKMVQDLDREMVVCVHTASNGRVISASVCSVGTMDQALVSPAEVLRTALLAGARGILLLHNHPSGSCQPSMEDLNLTKKMATAADFMGIKLLDFIVIGAYGYTYSVNDQDEQWLMPEYHWFSAGKVTDEMEEMG